MMNKIVLIGRLTVDPELRYLPNTGTPIAKFSIAVNRSYKKNNQTVTDFIPIEVWGKIAEFCANYLEKGRLVAIEGSIHFDRYVDDSGQNRVYSKVVAKKVQALDGKNNKTQQSNMGQRDENGLDPNGFQAIDDDDIPF